MKMAMFTEAEQQTLSDWAGSQAHIPGAVLSVIEKVVAPPPGSEVFQVWTADDVELMYENVRSDREDDYETSSGGSERLLPPWTELGEAERAVLVEAGRKAIEYTEPASEGLYVAVEDALEQLKEGSYGNGS